MHLQHSHLCAYSTKTRMWVKYRKRLKFYEHSYMISPRLYEKYKWFPQKNVGEALLLLYYCAPPNIGDEIRDM